MWAVFFRSSKSQKLKKQRKKNKVYHPKTQAQSKREQEPYMQRIQAKLFRLQHLNKRRIGIKQTERTKIKRQGKRSNEKKQRYKP